MFAALCFVHVAMQRSKDDNKHYPLKKGTKSTTNVKTPNKQASKQASKQNKTKQTPPLPLQTKTNRKDKNALKFAFVYNKAVSLISGQGNSTEL